MAAGLEAGGSRHGRTTPGGAVARPAFAWVRPVSDRTRSDSRAASWPTRGGRGAGLAFTWISRREIDMRMDGQQESSNVEDVRGMGGGGGGFSIGGRGLGIGSVAIAVIAGWILASIP